MKYPNESSEGIRLDLANQKIGFLRATLEQMNSVLDRAKDVELDSKKNIPCSYEEITNYVDLLREYVTQAQRRLEE